MLSKEENELVCRIGPGPPGGQMLRRYWLPAILASELPEPDCAPIRVRVMGEDLIGFRDTEGRVGLVAANCPHRGASLFLVGTKRRHALRVPRLEVRRDGQCVDMPNEPRGEKLQEQGPAPWRTHA